MGVWGNCKDHSGICPTAHNCSILPPGAHSYASADRLHTQSFPAPRLEGTMHHIWMWEVVTQCHEVPDRQVPQISGVLPFWAFSPWCRKWSVPVCHNQRNVHGTCCSIFERNEFCAKKGEQSRHRHQQSPMTHKAVLEWLLGPYHCHTVVKLRSKFLYTWQTACSIVCWPGFLVCSSAQHSHEVFTAQTARSHQHISTRVG